MQIDLVPFDLKWILNRSQIDRPIGLLQELERTGSDSPPGIGLDRIFARKGIAWALGTGPDRTGSRQPDVWRTGQDRTGLACPCKIHGVG